MATSIKYQDKTAGTTKTAAMAAATYTVVAGDVTAGYVDFDLSEIGGALSGAVVQVRDSAGDEKTGDLRVTLNQGSSNGVLRVADEGTTTLAANDTVHIIAWTA